MYLVNLAYGVTTTRDPQTAHHRRAHLRATRWRPARCWGPRIYSTGPGVFWSENIQSLDDARNVLKRYSEFYHTKTIKQYMAGNRKQRQWVDHGGEGARPHADDRGRARLQDEPDRDVDGYPGHEHSYPIMPLFQDVVELAARSASPTPRRCWSSTAVPGARTTSTSGTTSTRTPRSGGSCRTRRSTPGRSGGRGSARTSTSSRASPPGAQHRARPAAAWASAATARCRGSAPLGALGARVAAA